MLEKLHLHLRRLSVFLITAALIAGMAGCDGTSKYSLTVAVAPSGGGMATDLTNASPYAAGTVVTIKAEANEGYLFSKWEATAGTFANANFAETTFTMPAQDVIVTADFVSPLISTWYDLDAIRNNLSGNYTLMNDLDSTTAGYTELVSPTANGGKGWEPVGTEDDWFTGSFDGQGYEIRELFIDRPDETLVGLFGIVNEEGVVENIGVVNAIVTGNMGVGGLGGGNLGNVANCYATGSVTGDDIVGGLLGDNGGNVTNSHFTGSVTGTGSGYWGSAVGGLVGANVERASVTNSYSGGSVTGYGNNVGGLLGLNLGSTVSDSYSTASVTGEGSVGGGLVGVNAGTVSNSCATGSVTGTSYVGGLVGVNVYTMSNSYSTGSVSGTSYVGGLVGWTGTSGIVNNSYYNYGEVLINGENMITTGALFAEDFDQWLANDKFLDVNERLSQENGYYLINNVSDFKDLLAFGQDGSLKFRLTDDLDLATEPNFYIPYLAGEFDGNGHKISNFSLSLDSVAPLGLFGYLAPGGNVTQVGVENINVTGYSGVGGLVGRISESTVSHSYSTGSVTGNENVGGLVGENIHGTVSDSYATGNVTGDLSVGGLAGYNRGTVSNSYASGTVTGNSSVGGLVGHNYFGTVSNCYSSGTVTGNLSVGGLVGQDYLSTVSNSFWDMETSGQADSDGGTGKTTTEMQDITTFSLAGWNIIAVGGSGERNPVYIWNIVNNVTYPFLSWQPV